MLYHYQQIGQAEKLSALDPEKGKDSSGKTEVAQSDGVTRLY
jgi:hypothetical protein